MSVRPRCIRIRKGLDVRLSGEPEQVIRSGPPVREVALMTADHPGLRARAQVGVGESVRLGQSLLVDRRNPDLRFTSPGSGVVTAVLLSARRRLEAVVVSLEGEDEESFRSWEAAELAGLRREEVEASLLQSGLWAALRTRPHGRVPMPGAQPDALFVTAIDTHPLAVDPAVVIAPRSGEFEHGLLVLAALTSGSVHVCHGVGFPRMSVEHQRLRYVRFEGPHPAGLPGTHVHRLAPVGPERTIWHVGYQDVLAIGRLFATGRLDPERVVSVAGPSVLEPRVLRTRLGASLADLTEGRLASADPTRVISGSVLSGRGLRSRARWLGRYHLQVCALPEPAGGAGERAPRRGTTALHGRPTGFVPTERQDAVFPFDIPPAPLLRALEAGHVDQALRLGCLELDEEDLALLTHVSPSKLDHGARLREVLTTLAKEGVGV